MKIKAKKFYLIPGGGEHCNLKRYQELIKTVQKSGYFVVPVNPDWTTPLSKQVFPIEKGAIIFGFSFGAVLAYLIAKKYPCRKAIFASMSSVHTFSSAFLKFLQKILSKRMSVKQATEFIEDIKSIKINLKGFKTPYISLAGELENKNIKISADRIIPKVDHRINKAYIEYVKDALISD